MGSHSFSWYASLPCGDWPVLTTSCCLLLEVRRSGKGDIQEKTDCFEVPLNNQLNESCT